MSASVESLFPPTTRVIYDAAPLVQVICQLRFPQLLAIDSKPPADFQESIRGWFPFLQIARPTLPPDMPAEVAQMMGVRAGGGSYQFFTEDRQTVATLTNESLALSTSRYEEWAKFREQLRPALNALNAIYKPSFFTRIGLRYVDAIDRAALGLTDRPWSKLLRPEILGELTLPAFEQHLGRTLKRTVTVNLPDGSGTVAMRHGLGNWQDRTGCYMIDFDFYTQRKVEVNDAESTLTHFNAMAGNAFRWCILDELSKALRPRAP